MSFLSTPSPPTPLLPDIVTCYRERWRGLLSALTTHPSPHGFSFKREGVPIWIGENSGPRPGYRPWTELSGDPGCSVSDSHSPLLESRWPGVPAPSPFSASRTQARVSTALGWVASSPSDSVPAPTVGVASLFPSWCEIPGCVQEG